jgi:helix-turn-helix protein
MAARLQPRDGAHAERSHQRSTILQLLRNAGPDGVSKAHLVFERHFTQAAARIWELEKQGFQIKHQSRDDSRYVYFVLVSEPTEPQPKTADWYEETTGKPRPASPKPDDRLPPKAQAYAQGTLPLADAIEGRD